MGLISRVSSRTYSFRKNHRKNTKMAIDISHRGMRASRDRKVRRKATKSNDLYLNMLVKLYRFLARRTDSKFNKILLKRLFMSRQYRPALSLSRLSANAKEGKIIVCVGTVTNDTRLNECPKIKLAALRVTETARKRILEAGGEIISLDQLAQQAPLGQNTLLLQGPKRPRSRQTSRRSRCPKDIRRCRCQAIRSIRRTKVRESTRSTSFPSLQKVNSSVFSQKKFKNCFRKVFFIFQKLFLLF